MHKISFDLGDDARCYRPSLPALIYFHKCIFNTWATRAFPEYLDSQVPNSPRPKFVQNLAACRSKPIKCAGKYEEYDMLKCVYLRNSIRIICRYTLHFESFMNKTLQHYAYDSIGISIYYSS